MSDLVVRRLLIDLNTPFARLWNGGDAFRTAYFNALSMSFPAGEQFFIDAVRNGVNALPAGCDAVVTDTQGFIAQEATHRRIHALFNAQLAEQGHVNTWEKRIRVRQQRLEGVPPLHAVAATAASEHFTAIFSEYLLAHPQVFEGAEPRLRTMWLWHSAEELEHRCAAFDLYRALDGDEFWRRLWMRVVTLYFVVDVLRQTARNLWHDGALWRWSTWRSAASFFFGRQHGLVRHAFGPWRAYFKAGFHPSQQHAQRGVVWLRDNAAEYAVAGPARIT